MENRWVLKPQGASDIIDNLTKALNVSEPIANLLAQRSVSTFDEAKAFFRPDLKDLHDPFEMKDMDKATERIYHAIENNEKILVYGDYDVDGTTAVALMYSFLKYYHHNVGFYIPNREEEGYGISYKGMDYAAEKGYSLVVALDCGIKAIEKMQYAREKGIDFIICDHHLPGDEIPDACAVLDPKRHDCNYPYKELSGCGVGFKLAQALCTLFGSTDESVMQYIDLVAISIAADIVEIAGENRILAHFGLKKINSRPRPGIEAILRYSGVHHAKESKEELFFSRELTINDMVFLIGPRINAAGRIESASKSVELLISTDITYACRIAEEINKSNDDRKKLDFSITEEALTELATCPDGKQPKCTLVYNPDWHKGVIGIVASRLMEYYYRPTIVFTFSNSNGLITGSARSVKNYDIYQAIDACSSLLEHFGGHKFAAGMALKPENFEAFKKRFIEYVENTIQDEMLIPELLIDTILPLEKINDKFYNVLKQFAPFGPGNMSPLFLAPTVVAVGEVRLLKDKHLKMKLSDADGKGDSRDAIGFQLHPHQDLVKSGQAFQICYHIEENTWNGKTALQLNLKDIKPEE